MKTQMIRSITDDILICDSCQGKGYVTSERMVCYHKGEYDVDFHLCSRCHGSGLLRKKITSFHDHVEETPYNPVEILKECGIDV